MKGAKNTKAPSFVLFPACAFLISNPMLSEVVAVF